MNLLDGIQLLFNYIILWKVQILQFIYVYIYMCVSVCMRAVRCVFVRGEAVRDFSYRGVLSTCLLLLIDVFLIHLLREIGFVWAEFCVRAEYSRFS